MKKRYDYIVIETGGVGSASIYYVARRRMKVSAFERFPLGHDRGSSHGDTRVICMAYFEHPDYVPLLRRAYELWNLFSATCGQQLYHEVGLIEIGNSYGEVVPGVLRSAQEHDLKIERYTASEVTRQFPGFTLPETMTAVFEQ